MARAAVKCNRRNSFTDDAEHAVRMAEIRAESSGRRYAIFSAGPLFRVRRVSGNPTSALEIVRPSWDYDKTYRKEKE